MVGIVIVSHSRTLATGLLALARQMANPDLPIAIAAGSGDEHAEFGTDAIEIMDAIQSVYSEDGVLVLMDLGSAILSADTARELLPPEMAEKLRFCAAPLVEGAVAAAVQAGLGADLNTVCTEASSALLAKQEQLGQVASPTSAPVSGFAPVNEITLTLKNIHGLHARPAARFVQTAAAFDADVRVRNLTNGKGPVTARSLNGVATLAAVGGHQVGISAQGPEAAQALEALRSLVESGFGEQEQAAATATPAARIAVASIPAAGSESAVPIAEGIALGTLHVYKPAPPPIPVERISNFNAEIDRLEAAIATTGQNIRQQKTRVRASASADEAAIFDAHLLILQDPEVLDAVKARIQRGENAAFAYHAVAEETAASYQALPDAYLQQRAVDVLDVARQVLYAISGGQTARIELPDPVILIAQDLTPSETSQLEMDKVLGLLTIGGGPTSHSAILARALGIPAVSGANPTLMSLPAGTLLGMDGSTGSLWINPSSDEQAVLESRRQAWLSQRQEMQRTSQKLATMADGTRIEVAANIGSVQDAQAAVKNGAEGVGLLRTEFLFLTRQSPPSEDEQALVLSEIGAVMGDRPVIVRTLDAGGDKELPYAGLAAEANPYLGVRAIRVSLSRPELFQPQLRAILRAGLQANFRIMFPMIASLGEVEQAKLALAEAHTTLEQGGIAHCWPVETGIMVEVPAAALLSDLLAEHVDFFSIGTNDLTQYTLAAERGNPLLAYLADALHPAVLRLIQRVCEAARMRGKWVGVCGELGGDPLGAAILVGLGVRELSMTATSIPRVKQLLGRIQLTQAQQLASEILNCTSAEAVRQRGSNWMEALPSS